MQLKIVGLCCFIFLGVTSVQADVPPVAATQRLDKRDALFSLRGESLYLGKRLFNGVQFELYGNGALYRETQYKDGRKNGYEKLFSLDGGLRTLWNYKKGKKEGEQFGWFEDGSKRFLYHYKEGIFEGEQIEWHQNGVMFRRQLFHNGYESEKKILFSGGEIFTNYIKRDQRIYGIDGGALCFEKKKDGER